MSGRRHLSEEERTLCSSVARSIRPLRGAREAMQSAVTEDGQRLARHAGSHEVAHHKKQPSLVPLDRRVRLRVARGREPIDACLDLHGLSQAKAHAELLRFLRRAQADGAKIVLIVTGKGMLGNATAAERGVLRRQVPAWLSLPEFRSLVVGFEAAHAVHGGHGALYVRVRRLR